MLLMHLMSKKYLLDICFICPEERRVGFDRSYRWLLFFAVVIVVVVVDVSMPGAQSCFKFIFEIS